MITSVNSVLVANSWSAKGTTEADWKVGELAMFDENRKFITDESAAAKASAVSFGVVIAMTPVTEPKTSTVKNMPVFKYSSEVQKAGKPSVTIVAPVDVTEEKVEINFGSAQVVAGHRYVLRIVFKDINEAPGQFTHTYETVATDATVKNVIDALVAKVNKHPNRRVAATGDTTKITLTALVRDDNEGVDSLNEYAQVNMEVSLYETIPGALLSNQPKAVDGVTITKTPANPGRGNWKIVRDEEKKYMGYQGHVFTGAYPTVEQKLLVKEGAQYNTVTIESNNLYLSNDNQYRKTTPIAVTLYINKEGDEEGLTKKTGEKLIKAFITGEASE